jgi:hypothetical protein
LTEDQLTFTTALQANTWYRIGARATSSAFAIFLNGTQEASAATGALPSGETAKITLLNDIAGQDDDPNGTIAEAAVWNTALTDDEMRALGKGVSPQLVRPANLIYYVPAVRDVLDVKGNALTVTGTTVADHSPVIYAGPSFPPPRRSAAQTVSRRVMRIRGARQGFLFPPSRLVDGTRRQQVRKIGGYL